MNYQVILRDASQIEITEDDYNNISKFLGKLKLFRLKDGQIINAVDISRISPIAQQQLIRKEFRIAGPKEKEERIKVRGGGWQKPSVRERMIKIFNLMKLKGLFEQFDSYENWEKANYGKLEK